MSLHVSKLETRNLTDTGASTIKCGNKTFTHNFKKIQETYNCLSSIKQLSKFYRNKHTGRMFMFSEQSMLSHKIGEETRIQRNITT